MFAIASVPITTYIYFLLIILLAHIISKYGQGISKYPGPFLASITNLYRFNDVTFNAHKPPMLSHHRKYGKIVRYGPNMLSFSDPEATKDIYEGKDPCPKSGFFATTASYIDGKLHENIFSTTDEAWHGKMRRAVGPAFTMSAVAQLEVYVDQTIGVLISTLTERFASHADASAKGGKAFELVTWMQYFAFDVLGQLLYGERHGFIEKGGDVGDIIGVVDFGNTYTYLIGQIPWIDCLLLKNPILIFLLKIGWVDMTFAAFTFAKRHMTQRENREKNASGSDEEKGDMLNKLLALKDKNPELLDDTEITKVCAILVFAGSDTTAITLSALFYFLLQNPSAYTKLQTEIDNAMETNDDTKSSISFAKAQSLSYLKACLNETFRMHPAAGFNMERVVPKSGRSIAGEFVPGGTIVSVSAWAVHYNPEIFGEDVEVFRPERWLEGEQKAKTMSKSLLHFGAGNHICLGRNVSLLEMYKLVPVFLSTFTLEMEEVGRKWEMKNRNFVKPVGFNVKLTRRE